MMPPWYYYHELENNLSTRWCLSFDKARVLAPHRVGWSTALVDKNPNFRYEATLYECLPFLSN